MLTTSGERVVLQTAVVVLQSTDGSVRATARVLLDSASQRTFMTDQLARQLRLKVEHKELLSVSTFGAMQATKMDTYVVHFNVELKDKSVMFMSANLLKQITGNIQRGPLLAKDQEFLQLIPKSKMADCVLNSTETTTIDLLIDSDYFWEIVGGDKVVLPSGMFMLPSNVETDCKSNNPCALFVTTEFQEELLITKYNV